MKEIAKIPTARDGHSQPSARPQRDSSPRLASSFRIAALSLLLMVTWSFQICLAQEHEFYKRGPVRDSLSSIDSVNISNLNGIMNIPIGPTLPIGGDVGFGLNLVYNSKIWDVIAVNPLDRLGTSGPVPVSRPSRKSTAGAGWTLSLGRLIPPYSPDRLNTTEYWMYIDPGGAEHIFYPELRGGQASLEVYRYARDGSYLRFQLLPGVRKVEYPSGEVHVFDLQNRLIEITDRYSDPNKLTITYTDSDKTVVIEDKHERVWVLRYDDIPLPGFTPPIYTRVIRSVETPGFGTQATYDFEYDETAQVQPGCHDPYGTPAHITVPLLERVLLPDAGTSEDRLEYDFEYYESDVAGTNYSHCRQGALSRTTLPTGGVIQWDYQAFEIPGHCQSSSDRLTHYWSRTAGIQSREYFDVDGSSLARWSYFVRFSRPPVDSDLPAALTCDHFGGGQEAPEAMAVVETLPTDDEVYHLFTIWPHAGTSQHGADEYHYQQPYVLPGVLDLPFQLDSTPFVDGGGRYLSKVKFDCNGTAGCQRFSADYIRYESDYHPVNGGSNFSIDFDGTHRNDRMVSSRTVYYGDGDESYEVVTNFSDFDGLGHFRRTEITSTFPGEPGRTSLRDYNPSLGTLILNASHGANWGSGDDDYRMFPETDEWVLGTFASEQNERYGVGNRREFNFDADTGFLRRVRVLADTGYVDTLERQANDLLTVYEHLGDGNAVAESSYGGDVQDNLGLGDLADLSLADWEYRTERIFESGFAKKETQIGRDGGELVVKDLTLDPNKMGLPIKTRDAAGVETLLGYDGLGRLTSVTPAQDAKILATRFNATVDSGEKIVLERKVGGGAALAEEQVVTDGFGRNVLEETLYPEGKWSSVRYEYGDDGFLSKISTPFWRDSTAQIGWTEFKEYDPMGRPLLTRAPDNKEVRLSVDREHIFETTSQVATSLDGGESSTSKKIFKDSQGRVIRVEEPSNDGDVVATTYDFDAGGRLKRVYMPYDAAGHEGFQERRFTYDSRGFLLSERHPEKGAFGNGLVRYSNYDSRGLAGNIIDGSHSLRNIYDDLGRLTQVWDDSADQIVVERFYSSENRANGADKAKGRLALERRHNYPGGSSEDLIISRAYEYNETQGRLSRLRFRATSGLDVVQDLSYDTLGKVNNYGFPMQDVLPGASDPDIQAQALFQAGHLVGLEAGVAGQPLDSVVQSMIYGPPGSVIGRTHANGVNDSQLLDDSGLGRPKQFFTEHVLDAENWDSGIYSYDGSGNIEAIGSDAFAYDGVQRLKQARVSGISEDYVYDQFGNLLQLGLQERGIDIATNRVNDGSQHYDDTGNVLSISGPGPARTYTYDLFDRATSMTESGQTQRYIYGPGNERIAILDDNGSETWTLRDSGNRVVREYKRQSGGDWLASRDYFHADRLVASLQHDSEEGLKHYHLDHLGSTRLVTDGTGKKVSGHTYLPFGEEIPDVGNAIPDGERLKFTGHERDGVNQDYMHARFYGGLGGRFLSVDPVLGKPELPQSWNRYVYALNSPINFTDPDGRCVWDLCVVETATATLVFEAVVVSVAAIAILATDESLTNSQDQAELAVMAAELFETEEEADARKLDGGKDGDRKGKTFTKKGKKVIHDRADGKCEACGADTVPAEKSEKGVSPPGNQAEADHVYPKSKGGNGDPSNGQSLCRTCNADKSDTLPRVWKPKTRVD